MKAKQEIKDLGKELEQEFKVAIKPDHPFLLVGPDLLVSANGHLDGIFVLKSDEADSPDKLLIRLALSRLALPNHLRCVLILDPFDRPSREIFGIHFHGVFFSGHYAELIAFIKDPSADSRVQPIPPEIRKRTFEKFNAFYAESQERAAADQEGRAPMLPLSRDAMLGFGTVQVPSWTGQLSPYHTQAEILRLDSLWLTQVTLAGRSKPLDKIRSFCNASVLLDYSLDVGIPYPREKNFQIPKIMLVDKLPVSRGDPYKIIRAAAFAGWSTARAKSIEEVEQVGQAIHARLEGESDEHL